MSEYDPHTLGSLLDNGNEYFKVDYEGENDYDIEEDGDAITNLVMKNERLFLWSWILQP